MLYIHTFQVLGVVVLDFFDEFGEILVFVRYIYTHIQFTELLISSLVSTRKSRQ